MRSYCIGLVLSLFVSCCRIPFVSVADGAKMSAAEVQSVKASAERAATQSHAGEKAKLEALGCTAPQSSQESVEELKQRETATIH